MNKIQTHEDCACKSKEEEVRNTAMLKTKIEIHGKRRTKTCKACGDVRTETFGAKGWEETNDSESDSGRKTAIS